MKYPPLLAFTEHGAIMAATVLNSRRAVQMSIFVVRAFLRLRAWAVGQARTVSPARPARATLERPAPCSLRLGLDRRRPARQMPEMPLSWAWEAPDATNRTARVSR